MITRQERYHRREAGKGRKLGWASLDEEARDGIDGKVNKTARER
jgi:hypothetical protein